MARVCGLKWRRVGCVRVGDGFELRIGFFERGVLGYLGWLGWEDAYVHSHILSTHSSLG